MGKPTGHSAPAGKPKLRSAMHLFADKSRASVWAATITGVALGARQEPCASAACRATLAKIIWKNGRPHAYDAERICATNCPRSWVCQIKTYSHKFDANKLEENLNLKRMNICARLSPALVRMTRFERVPSAFSRPVKIVCERKPPSTRMSSSHEMRLSVRQKNADAISSPLTETAHGRMRPDRLGASGWRAVVVKQQFAILFRGKKAGRNAVDADAFGRPFAREKLGQRKHGSFAGTIGDHAGERQMSGNARDVDDRAVTPRAHRRGKLLARKEHAANEVEVEVRAPILERDRFKGALRRHRNAWVVPARRIDQNAGRTELLADRFMRHVQ